MKRLALFALVLMAASVSAATPADQAALSWTKAPTNCAGGVQGPLLGFRVYYGKVGRVSAGLPAFTCPPPGTPCPCSDATQVQANDPKVPVAYPNVITIPDPNVLVKTITFTDTAKYYFAVAAFDASGSSPLTNEVTKAIVAGPPTSPTLLAPACAGCTNLPVTLLVGVTGIPTTINWTAVAGATSYNIELRRYPVRAGDVPTAKGTMAGTATSWAFNPGRSDLFYSRMQSCSAAGCSAWVDSFAQGFLYYFGLAPASGGGIN